MIFLVYIERGPDSTRVLAGHAIPKNKSFFDFCGNYVVIESVYSGSEQTWIFESQSSSSSNRFFFYNGKELLLGVNEH